ncbi:hypothetical protein D3C79_945560 [compost metagenome]
MCGSSIQSIVVQYSHDLIAFAKLLILNVVTWMVVGDVIVIRHDDFGHQHIVSSGEFLRIKMAFDDILLHQVNPAVINAIQLKKNEIIFQNVG